MIPTVRLSGSLVLAAALALPGFARWVPALHLSGVSVEYSTPGRLATRSVDIVINDWSETTARRQLARTLVDDGPAALLASLCTSPAVGWIRVAGNRDIPVRYAWRTIGRDGSRRIYLASDEPISLTAAWLERQQDVSLTFLEIRLDNNGDGIGTLGDAAHLSVDELGDGMSLSDYDTRPAQLIMLRRVE